MKKLLKIKNSFEPTDIMGSVFDVSRDAQTDVLMVSNIVDSVKTWAISGSHAVIRNYDQNHSDITQSDNVYAPGLVGGVLLSLDDFYIYAIYDGQAYLVEALNIGIGAQRLRDNFGYSYIVVNTPEARVLDLSANNLDNLQSYAKSRGFSAPSVELAIEGGFLKTPKEAFVNYGYIRVFLPNVSTSSNEAPYNILDPKGAGNVFLKSKAQKTHVINFNYYDITYKELELDPQLGAGKMLAFKQDALSLRSTNWYYTTLVSSSDILDLGWSNNETNLKGFSMYSNQVDTPVRITHGKYKDYILGKNGLNPEYSLVGCYSDNSAINIAFCLNTKTTNDVLPSGAGTSITVQSTIMETTFEFYDEDSGRFYRCILTEDNKWVSTEFTPITEYKKINILYGRHAKQTYDLENHTWIKGMSLINYPVNNA